MPTYVRTYVHTYIHTYIHTHIHIHTYTHTLIHIHDMYRIMYYIELHTHTYIYIYLYVHGIHLIFENQFRNSCPILPQSHDSEIHPGATIGSPMRGGHHWGLTRRAQVLDLTGAPKCYYLPGSFRFCMQKMMGPHVFFIWIMWDFIQRGMELHFGD